MFVPSSQQKVAIVTSARISSNRAPTRHLDRALQRPPCPASTRALGLPAPGVR